MFTRKRQIQEAPTYEVTKTDEEWKDILPADRARSKLGQPDPESNFASVSKSSAPQPAQRKTPSPSTWSSSPDQAGSVPALRRTA